MKQYNDLSVTEKLDVMKDLILKSRYNAILNSFFVNFFWEIHKKEISCVGSLLSKGVKQIYDDFLDLNFKNLAKILEISTVYSNSVCDRYKLDYNREYRGATLYLEEERLKVQQLDNLLARGEDGVKEFVVEKLNIILSELAVNLAHTIEAEEISRFLLSNHYVVLTPETAEFICNSMFGFGEDLAILEPGNFLNPTSYPVIYNLRNGDFIDIPNSSQYIYLDKNKQLKIKYIKQFEKYIIK